MQRQLINYLRVTLLLLAVKCVVSLHANDECGDGWIKYDDRKCLYLNDELAVSFNEAREICAKLDSTMLSIHSDDEQRFVKEYLSRNLTWFEVTANYYWRYHVWLGGELSPPGSSNITWHDGSPFNFSDWDYPRHPSRECAKPDTCCALSMALTKRSSWIDFNCDALYSVACQRPIPQKFEQFKPQEVYDSNSAFSVNERLANCFLMAPVIFVPTAAAVLLRW